MLASAGWSRLAVASRLVAAAATMFVAPTASAQGADLAVARKCFEDIWVRHDTTAVARCQAPSYPEHGTAGDTVSTHASTYAFLREVFGSYPDIKGTVLEQIPHGDRIITRWRVVGTHKDHEEAARDERDFDRPDLGREDGGNVGRVRQHAGAGVARLHDHAT
jgi:hypothetical protein